MVQESLNASLCQELVAAIGDDFTPGDMINTSINLNRDIVEWIRQELTKGEVLTVGTVAQATAESVSGAVSVAWDVYLERTKQERPPVKPEPEPELEPEPEPEPVPEPVPAPIQTPLAVNDTDTANEGETVQADNILSNDTLGDAPVTLAEADQGGRVITLGSAFDTTEGGSLVLRANGSYSYTPPGFGVPEAGQTEVFNYTITDDDGDSSSATLSVTVRDNGLPLPTTLNFSSPARLSAVAIDNEPTILISSYGSGLIGVLNLESMQIDRNIRVTGKPTGIAFAFDKFYVGSRNGSVEVLDRNGNRLYFLGGGQNAFGQVNDLAVDEDAGLLYILDSKNARIRVYRHDGSASLRVFDSSGSQLSSIAGATSGGMMGFGGTLFSTPQGVYADGQGNVYVVDARFGEVQVFELATGTQLYTLGSLGTGFEELFYPLGVLCGSDDPGCLCS